MGKKTFIGVGNVARKVKKIYLGVGGVARRVKKGYIGINNIAHQFYSAAANVSFVLGNDYNNDTGPDRLHRWNPPTIVSLSSFEVTGYFYRMYGKSNEAPSGATSSDIFISNSSTKVTTQFDPDTYAVRGTVTAPTEIDFYSGGGPNEYFGMQKIGSTGNQATVNVYNRDSLAKLRSGNFVGPVAYRTTFRARVSGADSTRAMIWVYYGDREDGQTDYYGGYHWIDHRTFADLGYWGYWGKYFFGDWLNGVCSMAQNRDYSYGDATLWTNVTSTDRGTSIWSHSIDFAAGPFGIPKAVISCKEA